MTLIEMYGGSTFFTDYGKAAVMVTLATIPCLTYTVRRHRVRRRLERKLPDRRLRIDGVQYVH